MSVLQRGGASKLDRLLQGLEKLLDSVAEADEQAEDPDTEALCQALRGFLARKPVNMLQELKALIGKFSKPGRASQAGAPAAPPVRANAAVTTAKGPDRAAKGTGKGKDKGVAKPSADHSGATRTPTAGNPREDDVLDASCSWQGKTCSCTASEDRRAWQGARC